MKKIHRTLLMFLLVAGSISIYYGVNFASDDKREFMPGKIGYSHHQIELACDSCHGESFSGDNAIEARCRQCHSEELKLMDDAHGSKKFGDPRNAKWLQALDAKRCLSCHQEHRDDKNATSLVSQPIDFCVACHLDVADDRPSHRDIEGKTCASAGCHHYHDNRALHEDFITAHLDESDLLQRTLRPQRKKNSKEKLLPDREVSSGNSAVINEWASSSHANGHANCSDCHGSSNASWSVDFAVCKNCHEDQFVQWQQGHHGMSFAQTNQALDISTSKLTMKSDVLDSVMNCNSCHKTHRYDTRFAEADACLSCHADQHTLAWEQSSHAKRWRENPEQGASCATCHLPRVLDKASSTVTVMHNNSLMMRPQEKMLRPVCMQCHGFGFSLRALSDASLVTNNFSTKPPASHQSLQWVQARLSGGKLKQGEKKQ